MNARRKALRAQLREALDELAVREEMLDHLRGLLADAMLADVARTRRLRGWRVIANVSIVLNLALAVYLIAG